MRVNEQYPLDVALARGFEFKWNGRDWNLSPITLDDWAKILSKLRSDALHEYEMAQKGVATNFRQRLSDVNSILFGMGAQRTLERLRDPRIRPMAVKLSLQKNHPDISDEDVKAICEEEFRGAMVGELVEILSLAPPLDDPTAQTKGEGVEDDENPTSQPSGTSGKKSAGSPQKQDGPSTK